MIVEPAHCGAAWRSRRLFCGRRRCRWRRRSLLLWIGGAGSSPTLDQPARRRRAASELRRPTERAACCAVRPARPGAFFERCSGPEADHWLPPDNVQEGRGGRYVAHRTSPTNIGHGPARPTLAAHDLGFLPAGEHWSSALDKTLTTVEALEAPRGPPAQLVRHRHAARRSSRATSRTVDSGNLAGALVAPGRRRRQLAEPYPHLRERGSKSLAVRALALADGMDFGFLYDRRRQLFTIGYRLADAGGLGRRRLVLRPAGLRSAGWPASSRSPRATCRRATGSTSAGRWSAIDGVPTLVSWSATMFEYLMPLLLTRSFAGTLLDQTCRKVVARQIDYGGERGVPWGISESAYDLVDRLGNYQYKEFGVPGLGHKRQLADELVIAPYATALAAHGRPRGGGGQPAAPRGAGGGRRVRLLRGDRLHRPPARRRRRGSGGRRGRPGRRHGAQDLHGAPPGHDPGGPRQRARWTTRWSSVSTPTRGCRPPSCCSRSASRGGRR